MTTNAITRPKRSGSRWLRLVTIAFISYSLAYLDRVNYGFGAAAGLAKDLGITSQTAALLGAVFFLGYFLFQVPGGHYAESRSAKHLLFWGLLAWGFLASATGIIRNIPLLFVDRFCLGIVESFVLPGLLVFLSHWFTRGERSRANTFLILGNPVTVLWASIVSGYLIAAIDWRWMFIIEGIPAIVWAFLWYRLVQDDPREATWLDPAERDALLAQLQAEQAGIPPVASLRDALTKPAVLVLSVQYLCWSFGIYGFVLWLPSIVKNASSLSIVDIGWLTSVPYVVAVVAMLLVSAYADRTLNRKGTVSISMFVGAAAFAGSYFLGASHFVASFLLLVVAGAAMYAPYGPFFAMIPDMLPATVVGSASALINSCGALGGFFGAYLVGYLNGLTGSATLSFGLMAASLFLAGVLTLAAPVPSGRRATAAGAAVHP